jgi:hypothetical protein
VRATRGRKSNGVAVALLAAVAIGAVAIPSAFSASKARVGDGILIKTHINFDPGRTAGEVLRGSFIGDSAFCRGGRFRDRPLDDGVIKTFRCANGSLKIRFEPQSNPDARTASGPWRVVGGSGRFEGMHGRGWMAVTLRPSSRDGRETFTGTVTP